ncbi:hemerythrin domain-containing protein [Paenibacillus roseipurpureus]|uniref:Hemerythrin domain-containing protein n=1 Tax=Paenibacillus roseopurpureus TaxID=2918901 RepID=A0AA96LK84_9BACL|nr:hemerythrin domain-containing protein [Paenibacillus sp. MBLB1832]WNR43442.1 hemerythrin domain-containing protein [Paenibacillus sp. MBLB1832]
MSDRLSIQTNRAGNMNPSEFIKLAQRLKEEHVQMREQLSEIRTMAAALYVLDDCSIGMCRLIDLQDRILSLVEELEQHSEWEEQELFPNLQSYLHPTMAISVSRSVHVLEQDHDLAKKVVQSYVNGVNAMSVPIDMDFVHVMASELLTACLILLKHFTLEEELVYPLMDRIVEQIS